MTAEELIPVLKALHADPGCAPMLADWFEERGEERVANLLRGGPRDPDLVFPWYGRHLVERVTYHRHWNVRANRDAVEQALIRECHGRMAWSEKDTNTAERELRYKCQKLLGTGDRPWVRVSPGHREARFARTPTFKAFQRAEGPLYPEVLDAGDEVRLHPYTVVFEPPSASTLCGGWLTYRCLYRVGRRADGAAVVSAFDPQSAEVVRYNTIPF